jgi:hypothetical protein
MAPRAGARRNGPLCWQLSGRSLCERPAAGLARHTGSLKVVDGVAAMLAHHPAARLREDPRAESRVTTLRRRGSSAAHRP